MTLRTTLLAAPLLLLAAAAHAGERGYLGISFSIDGEGFFLNPTLKSVKLDKVKPGSPAAKAGLEPGDLVVEIEGHQVAGSKASELKPYMEREVGQVVHLAVQKPGGEVKAVTMTAGPNMD